MAEAGLRSMLLASTDPERLGAWYAAALSPQEDQKVHQYRVLKFGATYLFIDTRDDVADATAEPGRIVLNFEVPDARAVVARMEEMGVTWVAELDDREGSLFATAQDPDGNYVQVIQLSQQELLNAAGAKAPLGAAPAYGGFSVDDIPAAKAFYADTLGLNVSEENGMLSLRLVGDRQVLVYPKDDHVPATYTVLNFPVEDVEATVDELTSRGVTFERYPDMAPDARGIHHQAGPAIAWFTDPAGNILSVHQA